MLIYIFEGTIYIFFKYKDVNCLMSDSISQNQIPITHNLKNID